MEASPTVDLELVPGRHIYNDVSTPAPRCDSPHFDRVVLEANRFSQTPCYELYGQIDSNYIDHPDFDRLFPVSAYSWR